MTIMAPLAVKLIDSWLAYQVQYTDVPGLQVSIRQKDSLVFSKGYGFANLPGKEPYTPKHIGRIASHTKLFTAVLTLLLQIEGKLHLDDRVTDHLPQFRRHRDKRFKDITLRDLLTNRSGLFRDGLDSIFWELESPFLSRTQLQTEILAADLVYAPNLYTKYSNIGFSLLGMALEQAGGGDYETLITHYVLSKLGKTSLLTDYKADKKYTYAYGHSHKIYRGERRLFKPTTTNGLVAATGFCGTTDAMTAFLHKLYHTDILLPLRLRNELLNLNWPVKNTVAKAYGLGTMFMTSDANIYVGHGGGYPGFNSDTRHLLGTDYTFSVIVNANMDISFNILHTMAQIIQKTATVFSTAEAAAVTLSKPMMNKWGATIYAVGGKKALTLPVLDTWLPVSNAVVLEQRKDGYYYSDTLEGIGSVGEPVQFLRKGKAIQSVKFGAGSAYPVEALLKRAKGSFA